MTRPSWQKSWKRFVLSCTRMAISIYNRWIRILAKQKGFKLTQHGLFRNNILLESFNERRIFELLNLKYAELEHRNIGWEKKNCIKALKEERIFFLIKICNNH
ncbi:CRE_HP_G0020910.mRNA.1.CDS.1 [Saccharomyces cerevisiae]|nr:CRE_HP_G0020910.mRNA.1.CDS.1 [Saccharomyces cerevisiae]CAI6460093.1 CRE_HP_G0020910.mRNA.1.CDS.1 [Saccharomyces cerevisiae]